MAILQMILSRLIQHRQANVSAARSSYNTIYSSIRSRPKQKPPTLRQFHTTCVPQGWCHPDYSTTRGTSSRWKYSPPSSGRPATISSRCRHLRMWRKASPWGVLTSPKPAQTFAMAAEREEKGGTRQEGAYCIVNVFFVACTSKPQHGLYHVPAHLYCVEANMPIYLFCEPKGRRKRASGGGQS